MTKKQREFFKQYGLEVSFSFGDNLCIHIENSHLIQDRNKIIEILDHIHETDKYKHLVRAGFTRSNESQIREWIGHNFLYNVGYSKSQTGSVDIDQYEPKWRRVLYLIFNFLSKFTKK